MAKLTAPLTRRPTGGLGRVSVADPPLSLSGSPVTGNEGTAWAFTPIRSYGTAPFTYNISAGTLPVWASINTGNGTISGNPVDGHNGATGVTIRVQDGLGASATLPITITINNNLNLTLSGAPGSSGEGVLFSFIPTRTNGVGPTYTYSISTGALPAWATLNTSTGEITGTPADGQNGITNLTLRVVDTAGSQALLPISIQIDNTLSIGLSGTPNTGNEGQAFAFTPTRTNGVPAYTYSIVAGSLPSWASLNTGTGAITGNPVDGDAGVSNFTIRVVDSTLASADLPVSLTVNNTLGGVSGQFAYLYPTNFTLDSGTGAVTRPAKSMPGKGTSITDVQPVNPFGVYEIQLTQAVSANNDDPDNGTMMRQDYSKRWWCAADSAQFACFVSGGYGHRYTLSNLTRVNGGRTSTPGNGAMGTASGTVVSRTREFFWHPTDANIATFSNTSNGDLQYNQWNRSTNAVTTYFTFAGGRLDPYFGSGVTDVWPKQEGRSSSDGRYWAFMAMKSGVCAGYFTYDQQTDTILGALVTTNEANWVTCSPLGNFCVIGWANASGKTKAQCAAATLANADGVRAYDMTLTSFTQINDRAQHGDVAIDIAGNEVWVGVSDSLVTAMPGVPQGRCYYAPLATGAPILLPINVYEGSNAQAVHFSGTATLKPGVVPFTTFGGSGVTAKHENLVGAVELKPTAAKVYRIAYHYSIKNVYDNEPHVVCNRDGTIIAWATNYNGGSKTVMNAALLPYEAIPYYGASGGGTGTGPDLRVQQANPFYAGNTTAHALTMPGPIPVGTGILICVSMDGAATLTNPLSLSTLQADQAAASNFKVSWLWKVADGTEGGATADFITSVAERGGVQMWLFEAGTFTGSPQISTGVETTTATPDPPPITPAGGTGNYFVIAAAAGGTSMTINPSSYPYTNGNSFLGLLGAGSANDACLASCWNKINGATFNPGTITWQTSTPSFAYTVALKSS